MNTKEIRTKVTEAGKLKPAIILAIMAVSETAIAQQDGLAGFMGELISTIVYSVVGIVMAVAGFKVVDWLTPGNLADEVAHKENRALAVLAGSMMLGVCIIIASVLIS